MNLDIYNYNLDKVEYKNNYKQTFLNIFNEQFLLDKIIDLIVQTHYNDQTRKIVVICPSRLIRNKLFNSLIPKFNNLNELGKLDFKNKFHKNNKIILTTDAVYHFF